MIYSLAAHITTLFVVVAAQTNGENQTVSLPNGTTNHGDPGLLCTPAKWNDIVIFYFANYFAHAATTLAKPGEPPLDRILTIGSALAFPIWGASRALDAIAIFFRGGKSNIQIALRAGALVTVVKESPEHTVFAYGKPDFIGRDLISRPGVSAKWKAWFMGQRIQGYCDSMPGYILKVHRGRSGDDAIHESFDWQMTKRTLPTNTSLPKSLIALIQSIYAVTTLYRAQGNQIEVFGYAAFGLTVTPYVVMSLLNLIAGLVCPEYPTMFLVESDEMKEAYRLHGCRYEIAIKMPTNPAHVPRDRRPHPKATPIEKCKFYLRYHWVYIVGTCFAFGIVLLPFLVLAGLTQFQPGSSTIWQRTWILSWLISGIFGSIPRVLFPKPIGSVKAWILTCILIVPAVGGFVMVGQMLMQYGTCIRID